MTTVRRLRRPPPSLPVPNQRNQFWWGEHDVWSRHRPRMCLMKRTAQIRQKKGRAEPALEEWICVGGRHFGQFLAQQTTCAMLRPLSVQRSEQFPFLCTSWQVPSPWPHARIPATEELAASQQRRCFVTKPWGLPVQRLNPLSIPGLWPNTLERKMQEPACCFLSKWCLLCCCIMLTLAEFKLMLLLSWHSLVSDRA